MINTQLKLSSTLVLSALALGVATPLVAHADDGGNYNTEAGVTFSQNNTPSNPVDPDDPNPNDPQHPVDPDGEDPKKGTDGPLSIDYVSSFDFGNQKISSANQTYYAKAQAYSGDKKDSALYAQVTDSRGTGAGWTLNVTQPTQLTAKTTDSDGGDTTSVLKGAEISINDLSANTQADSEAAAAKAGSNITLAPGNTTNATVMSAAKEAGQGVWVARMGSTSALSTDTNTTDGSERTIDKSVSLYVPGTSNKIAKAQYTADLVWQLNDTPANS